MAYEISRKELVGLVLNREHEGMTDLDALGGPQGVAAKLGSDPVNGLTDNDDFEKRRSTFGRNFVPPKPGKTFLSLVWDAFQDVTVIMLCISSVVSLGIWFGLEQITKPLGWVEGVAIVISVCVVVLVQAFTDLAKDRQFQKLNATVENTTVTVVRGGDSQVRISVHDVCVGDVVVLESGCKIPADGLFLSGDGLQCDESSLTGEPKLLTKSPASPFLLSGTQVKNGNGMFLAIAVGVNSESGRIRSLIAGGIGAEEGGEVGEELAAERQSLLGDSERPGVELTEVKVAEDEDEDEDGVESGGGADEKSVLFAKLDKLAVDIGKAGTVVAVVCMIVIMAKFSIVTFAMNGKPWSATYIKDVYLKAVIEAITILVVAIPEGLPLAVTLSLAFSSRQMQNDNNLVKHLDACETMGSATTICSDKTGTLTQNRMTAIRARVGGVTYQAVAGQDAASAKRLGAVMSEAGVSAELRQALGHGIAINSTGWLRLDEESGLWEQMGSKTECALLQWARDLGHDYDDIRAAPEYQVPVPGEERTRLGIKQIPFSSARKMMSWVVPHGGAGGARVYVKGASEIVLEKCAHIMTADGSVQPLTAEERAAIQTSISSFADDAMRTLVLACRDFPAGTDFDAVVGGAAAAGEKEEEEGADTGPLFFRCESEQLVFLGVAGIEDPLRPEVPGAIARCNSAGIDVRMVTGDNLNTAVAIARNCGILRPGKDLDQYGNPLPNVAMIGRHFRDTVFKNDEFNQAAFDAIWPSLRVLARSSPTDKHTLVNGLNRSMLFSRPEGRALVEAGKIYWDRQVVAVTGDGTNDAPALKRADVGFAMGIQGTDVAKDACDIILLDDNFSSIVKAAMWGRNVYDSISKFLQFQLTVNIAAIVIAAYGAIIHHGSPLKAVQMLWVNLIMDSLASLALATEPPTESLLDRAPYGRNKALVSRHMALFMGGHAFYQLIVVFLILEAPQLFPSAVAGQGGMVSGHSLTDPNEHYALVFNTFVCMQIFNEINSRVLYHEPNVLRGMTRNPIFCSILVGTIILQVLMVQYGGLAFFVVPLTPVQWGVSIAFGASELLVQLIHVAIARAFIKEDTGPPSDFAAGDNSEASQRLISGDDGETKQSGESKKGGSAAPPGGAARRRRRSSAASGGVFTAAGDLATDAPARRRIGSGRSSLPTALGRSSRGSNFAEELTQLARSDSDAAIVEVFQRRRSVRRATHERMTQTIN